MIKVKKRQQSHLNYILGVPAEKAGGFFAAIFFNLPKGNQKSIFAAIPNSMFILLARGLNPLLEEQHLYRQGV